MSVASCAVGKAADLWIGHHDFGAVTQGQTLHHELSLRNTTTQPLQIRQVLTSCDCLKVASFPRSIPPKSDGVVNLVAQPTNVGHVDYTVFVEAEDNVDQRFFTLSGWVGDAPVNDSATDGLVSPGQLLDQLGGGGTWVFVDIRSQDKYRLAHIPGSLNLPMFTLKTKGFLRAKRLVLLNEGHQHADLLQDAERLRQVEFKSVQVLVGGLRAWQQAGGKLEGEDVTSATIGELTPAQFHQAQIEPGWSVMNVAAPAELDATFVLHAMQSAPSARRILLMTPRGEDHALFERQLREFRAVPVFYLAGGAEASGEFLARQMAMQNRRLMTISSESSAKPSVPGRSTARSGGCCGGRR